MGRGYNSYRSDDVFGPDPNFLDGLSGEVSFGSRVDFDDIWIEEPEYANTDPEIDGWIMDNFGLYVLPVNNVGKHGIDSSSQTGYYVGKTGSWEDRVLLNKGDKYWLSDYDSIEHGYAEYQEVTERDKEEYDNPDEFTMIDENNKKDFLSYIGLYDIDGPAEYHKLGTWGQVADELESGDEMMYRDEVGNTINYILETEGYDEDSKGYDLWEFVQWLEDSKGEDLGKLATKRQEYVEELEEDVTYYPYIDKLQDLVDEYLLINKKSMRNRRGIRKGVRNEEMYDRLTMIFSNNEISPSTKSYLSKYINSDWTDDEIRLIVDKWNNDEIDIEKPIAADFFKIDKKSINNKKKGINMRRNIRKSADEEGYNGWKNYETWSVALWAGNEEWIYKKIVEYVEENGPFTAASAKEFAKDTYGLYPTNDLKNQPGRMRVVDWAEIANAWNETGELEGKNEGFDVGSVDIEDIPEEDENDFEGMEEWEIEALRNLREETGLYDLVSDDLEEAYYGDGFYASNGNDGYLVMKDKSQAKEEAIGRIMQTFEDEPSIFIGLPWLKNFVTIAPGDIGSIAREDAEGMFEDEEDKEDEIDEMADEIEAKIRKNPVGYFCDEQGIYTEEEFMELPWVHIDTAKAAKFVVDSDGPENELARENGEEMMLSGDYVAYKMN